MAGASVNDQTVPEGPCEYASNEPGRVKSHDVRIKESFLLPPTGLWFHG
jgi:hypothetical protein